MNPAWLGLRTFFQGRGSSEDTPQPQSHSFLPTEGLLPSLGLWVSCTPLVPNMVYLCPNNLSVPRKTMWTTAPPPPGPIRREATEGRFTLTPVLVLLLWVLACTCETSVCPSLS